MSLQFSEPLAWLRNSLEKYLFSGARCHTFIIPRAKAYLILVVSIVLVDANGIARAAALPSEAGPHVQLVNALDDNSWLELGKPSPDPTWGRARGRKWTSKMAYAPELGGAFLFGEGVHGWRNPQTGRYMDDLWFYDALSHRWLNLYPGFDTKNPPPIELNPDGFTSVDDTPLPIATMVHGYGMTAWDSDTRRFMSMPCPGVYWRKAIPSLRSLSRANPRGENRMRASPWFFDWTRGEWDRKKTTGQSPHSGFGDTLVYVPSRQKTFFRRKEATWFYDAAENRWTRIRPQGPKPPFGIEANSCLDPKRERIYLGGGNFPVAPGPNALWIFDVAANSWVNPQPEGSPGGNSYGTNDALLHCDLTNDVVVLIRHKGPAKGIHVYDPVANTWASMAGGMPDAWPRWAANGAVSGFYHADLNVHLIYVANDSRDNGRIFAYRYKGAD